MHLPVKLLYNFDQTCRQNKMLTNVHVVTVFFLFTINPKLYVLSLYQHSRHHSLARKSNCFLSAHCLHLYAYKSMSARICAFVAASKRLNAAQWPIFIKIIHFRLNVTIKVWSLTFTYKTTWPIACNYALFQNLMHQAHLYN